MAGRQARKPARDWSRAEKARLAELYPLFENAQIAQRMRRTVGAIGAQAYRMGLKKPPEFYEEVRGKPRRAARSKRPSHGVWGPKNPHGWEEIARRFSAPRSPSERRTG